MSWVINCSQQKGNHFVVLLMIANHAHADGTGAWPSIRTLAKECRISDRTVQRVIRQLVTRGELELETGTGRASNVYCLPKMRGDKMTPGDNLTPVTNQARGVTELCHPRGVITVSPEPSYNRPIEPSLILSAPTIKESGFKKPTIEEVGIYTQSRPSPIDAIKFWNYYESNGWKVGRVPMKNWKAAVVTWEKSKGGNGNGRTHESPAEIRARKNEEVFKRFRGNSSENLV